MGLDVYAYKRKNRIWEFAPHKFKDLEIVDDQIPYFRLYTFFRGFFVNVLNIDYRQGDVFLTRKQASHTYQLLLHPDCYDMAMVYDVPSSYYNQLIEFFRRCSKYGYSVGIG